MFKLTSEKAVMPERKNPGDVGYDLYISEDLRIDPHGFTDVKTDVCLYLEPGFWAMITGRSSSLRNHGILVNTGIIDGGYTGEMHIAVQNLRNRPFFLPAGSRIAQLIVLKIHEFIWVKCDELPITDRGSKGFGSTGT